MNKKKINTKLSVVIIVIFAITTGVFLWRSNKKNYANLNPQISLQSNKNSDLKKERNIEISDNWTLISHYNFWNNPNIFKRSAYKFPNIEFSYPANWEFQCCGDMEHASEHLIYSSKNHDKSLPYIRITDYVLSGCPNSQITCSLDKTIKLTANEKFNQIVSTVPSNQILQKAELKQLNIMAFVYKKSEKDNRFSKAYLINLKDDVIEIDFVNYELLDGNFIENFLNRISSEIK